MNQQHLHYKKGAEQRGVAWAIGKVRFKQLLLSNCFYCGAAPHRMVSKPGGSILANGIDRIDNSRGYTVDNCVTCCRDCNFMKGRLPQALFLQQVKKIAEHKGVAA